MKIGIDVSQMAHEGSGVARYVSALLESLIKYDKENEYVLFFSSLRKTFNANLKKKLNKNFIVKNSFVPPSFLDILWNRLHLLPVESLIGKVDIFFTSDWVEPPTRRALKITTIHDMIVYKFAQTSHSATTVDWSKLTVSANIVETQKRRLSWVKKESDLILCDSESTRKDVEKILKINSEKLKVLYPSVETFEPTELKLNEIKEKYNITKPFILTVGKIEPRKNIPKLIDAFQKTGIKDYDLLIVGPKGWESESFELSDNIKFLGFVSDEDLYAFYKLAAFFVFPSLYEGFGYPVVEAMSLGCPVATSNNSSLKEITKDNGLLFDPSSVDEIAKAIKEYYNDESLRKKMSEKGLKRAKDFSQEQFAKNLINIFENLYDNRN